MRIDAIDCAATATNFTSIKFDKRFKEPFTNAIKSFVDRASLVEENYKYVHKDKDKWLEVAVKLFYNTKFNAIDNASIPFIAGARRAGLYDKLQDLTLVINNMSERSMDTGSENGRTIYKNKITVSIPEIDVKNAKIDVKVPPELSLEKYSGASNQFNQYIGKVLDDKYGIDDFNFVDFAPGSYIFNTTYNSSYITNLQDSVVKFVREYLKFDTINGKPLNSNNINDYIDNINIIV